MTAPKSITHLYTKIKPSKMKSATKLKLPTLTIFADYPSHCLMGSKSTTTSALLDKESDSTSVTSDISQKLNLQGKSEQISLCNFLSNEDTFNSILVDFEISSLSSSTLVNVKNAWIVDLMKLPCQCKNIEKFKNYHNHYTTFNLHSLIKAVKIQYWLVQIIRCHTNRCRRWKIKRTHSLKTKLGSVIFGRNKSKNKSLSVNERSKECNLDEMMSNVWRLNHMVCLKSKLQPSCQKQNNKLLTFYKKELLIKIVDIPSNFYGIVTTKYS